MADDVSNDNYDARAGRAEPDAHGQSALLLVESLIHGLIANSVLSVAEAVKIVDIAAEVKADVAAQRGDSPAAQRQSSSLLNAISASLRIDLPRQ